MDPAPPASGRTSAAVFVGRDAELAVLQPAVEDALSGRGRVILLSGEAGIGKTRTAEELAAHARRRGARVIWASCQAGDGAPAFGPWVHVLEACADALGAPALRDSLGAGGADIAQLVPALRHLLPGGGLAAPSDTPEVRFRLFDAIAQLLEQVARQSPLMIVLDDAHVADPSSLLILDFLAPSVRELPLLLLLAYRDASMPSELARSLGELAREPATASVSLRGLGADEVAAFVHANLQRRPPARVTTALLDHTGGVPLLLGEFVRAMRSQRVSATLEGGEWERAIPHGVEALVTQRLAGIAPACRDLLGLAAAAGYAFRATVLSAALDGTALEQVTALLREAADAGLLRERSQADRWEFAHATIRDALYERLPADERARAHRRIAAGLEQLGIADDALAEVAEHYLAAAAAGDPDSAAPAAHAAERAAERAVTLLAYEDGVRLYRAALAVGTDDAVQRSRLLLGLGDALRRAGDAAAARSALAESIALARRRGEATLFARAVLVSAGRYMEVGSADEPLCAVLAEALVRLPSTDSALRARVLARLAVELAYTHEPERAAELSAEAEAVAARAGDPSACAYAFGAAHLTGLALHDPRERLAMADAILPRLEALGDIENAAEICGWRVDSLVELGDLALLEQAIDRHARLAARLQHPAHTWLAAMFRAMRVLLSGDLERGEAVAGEALQLGQRAQDPNAAHAYAAQLFFIRAEQRRLDELRDVIAASADAYPAAPGYAAGLANLHASARREAAAAAVLDRLAADGFASLPRDRTRLFTASLLAETSASIPGAPHAAPLYHLLIPFAGRHVGLPGGAVSWGAVDRYLGLLAAARQRWDDADRHFVRAHAMNSQMRAAPLVAHTQCDWASMLLRRDAGGDRLRAAELVRGAAAAAAPLRLVRVSARVEALCERYGLHAA